MIELLVVASARPNFMKVAPILKEVEKTDNNCSAKLIHTGQHYDYEMSKIFFDEIDIPDPDYHLEVGSGTHAEQTARVLIEFERVLDKENPDWVVVVGDVNPTMACTISAVKKGVKVAHVEAGLRSGDRTMPEEINRILTDSIADLLLTPSIDGNMNLVKEGVAEEKICFVGNIMIDTLYNMQNKAAKSSILDELKIEQDKYFLVTLHRPSNVDHSKQFENLIGVLEYAASKYPLVWPMHPRSRKRAKEFGFLQKLQDNDSIHLLEPIGYSANIKLMQHARLVMTDSGGIQEETTALGIPCITIRNNTERPITIEKGTNVLSGTEPENIISILDMTLKKKKSDYSDIKPLFWDGKTAKRIIEAIEGYGNIEL